MAGYEIRTMTQEDIPQIVAIERLVFPTPWSAAAFRSELEDNGMALYLILTAAADPATVLAYGGLWKIFDEGHITNVAVHPAHQGKKLGRFLIHAMIAWAWANGISHVTLEVRPGNQRAIALYKSVGFQEAGLRPGYYEDTREDALIMWLHKEKWGKRYKVKDGLRTKLKNGARDGLRTKPRREAGRRGGISLGSGD
ncbi:MAG: ribosomal protein S18-alanine N-acetyltransferase [Peptococcaceae bacterium]|jgi:ribosomal-protein-alanine N-acetyltransferase|nr:ribosomal protein S18-alanine N-acetyltransferase [Peptococcaceae bacterium]